MLVYNYVFTIKISQITVVLFFSPSLFDGFADGLGVAEAISYVDPQFLTYMALEERLAQAMETALAHLESLAVDVEVANPPASKESIDGLPETLVLEDHTAIGQEQCCPICCSEYIKDDIATELPCHHFFHKPCVSIWLQKYQSLKKGLVFSVPAVCHSWMGHVRFPTSS